MRLILQVPKTGICIFKPGFLVFLKNIRNKKFKYKLICGYLPLMLRASI